MKTLFAIGTVLFFSAVAYSDCHVQIQYPSEKTASNYHFRVGGWAWPKGDTVKIIEFDVRSLLGDNVWLCETRFGDPAPQGSGWEYTCFCPPDSRVDVMVTAKCSDNSIETRHLWSLMCPPS